MWFLVNNWNEQFMVTFNLKKTIVNDYKIIVCVFLKQWRANFGTPLEIHA